MLDALELLSDNQSLATGGTGAVLSTFSLDMWAGARQTTVLGNTPVMDMGRGWAPELEVRVGTAFTTAAGGTLTVELVMADNDALTSNLVSLQQAPGGSVTVGIAAATLVQGYKFRVGGKIPAGITKRYLGLRYTILTGAFTAGTVYAYLATSVSTAPGTVF